VARIIANRCSYRFLLAGPVIVFEHTHRD